MNTDGHGFEGAKDLGLAPLIVLVLSAAVLVLVLETAHHDLVLEHRDHTCPHFAIQSRPAFSAVESQRDGQVIASDANPRSRDRTNSQSRNATACVGCGCDAEYEYEYEYEAGRTDGGRHLGFGPSPLTLLPRWGRGELRPGR
jgi:hypothetical protein